jgi:hypothetical protein
MIEHVSIGVRNIGATKALRRKDAGSFKLPM